VRDFISHGAYLSINFSRKKLNKSIMTNDSAAKGAEKNNYA
jgi:hypothetical protein